MADRQKPLDYAPSGELYQGSKIRALRQANGWSLTSFGQQLGCQLSALSNIETNKVLAPRGLLERMATVLEVPLAELQAAPLPPALATKPTRRPPSPSEPEPVRRVPAAQQAPAPTRQPSSNGHRPVTPPTPWSFGDQVAAIIDSFRLTPSEQQLAHDLITDLVRTVCLRLKEASAHPPRPAASHRAVDGSAAS